MNQRHKASQNLEAVAERVRLYFSGKDSARENMLRLCREVIRASANAIRALHRQDKDRAERLLDSAAALLEQVRCENEQDHADLLHSGPVHDAQKEFVEGSITLAAIRGEPLPEPEALSVAYPAYLHGLGEATGELRRYVLDSLRRNELSRCEELLEVMDDIYGVLVTMDFPDAMTFGLRRTTDSVRGILEKTRGDLTLLLKQKELEEKILHNLPRTG